MEPVIINTSLSNGTAADACMAKVREHFERRAVPDETLDRSKPETDICPTTGQPHQPGNACIYCYVGNLGAKP